MTISWRKTFGAGVMGTIFITMMMYYVAPILIGAPMDIAAMLGALLGDSWTAGMIAHLVTGVILLPALYALVIHRILWGGAALRGVTWGILLWLVNQMAVMPLIGGGFFSQQEGGAMTVFTSLIGHVIYGLTVGVICGLPLEAGAPAAMRFRSHPHPRHAG